MDITYLETFRGYKGDTVLKVVCEKQEIRNKISKLANLAGLDFRTDFELDGRFSGQHNIFIACEDPDIYQLKG